MPGYTHLVFKGCKEFSLSYHILPAHILSGNCRYGLELLLANSRSSAVEFCDSSKFFL